jgi:hypothetical protein
MTADSGSTLKVAHQAFEHLQHGLATAEWTPMLEMLTEDFSFWFPVGQCSREWLSQSHTLTEDFSFWFPVGPYHGVKYRSSSLRDR